MSILSKPSGAFSTSLVYITVGTLIVIWTIVSMVYYPPETNWGKFLIVGFSASGIAVLVIGLLLGPIGRAARHAELPPGEVTPSVTEAEQTAAANPPPVVPPAVASNSAPQPSPPPPTPERTTVPPVPGPRR